MSKLREFLSGLIVRTKGEEAQGMVEYALILVLVSIVVIFLLLTMGNQIKNVFSNMTVGLSANIDNNMCPLCNALG